MIGLFEIRGKLSTQAQRTIELVGAIFFLGLWQCVSGTLIPSSILPSPTQVLAAFPDLHMKDALIYNSIYSIKLNTLGLLEAVAFALPLGMLIGLFPLCRALSERYVTAARFLPLTAVVGLFIAWFGIDMNMKVQFLAFAIFIYLLPVVIQKVDGMEEVLVSTVRTLGANTYQTVRSIFIPGVVSRVFDDIRVLAALSWTYIVVAEMVNAGGGGVGALTYIAARQSRIDKVFAILLVVVLIGFLQDQLLLLIDKIAFPYKYAKARSSK
jgi:NitT/TauT family transport system permease protein